MAEPKENGDGKSVVVENGQRASGLMSAEDAQKEAAKRKPTNESQGQGTKVEVKTNLFG
jgi:hypothetical protein